MKRLNEKQIEEKLREIAIPPLKINVRSIEPNLSAPTPWMKYQPDVAVDIDWETKRYRFLVEIKSVATPKIIEEAVAQLNLYLSTINPLMQDDPWSPMIVTPYLNPRQIDGLIESQISGIDLSGNAVIIVPEQLFICKTGNPNKYPSTEQIKNVYRWSSSIVARVFLSKPKFKSVQEIYDEIISRGGKTSLGTVSKVLKSMEEDFLISRKSQIELIDPKALLGKLVENYRIKGTRRQRIKVQFLDQFIGGVTQNCERENILFAIDEPQRYAPFPSAGELLRLYVEDLGKAIDGLLFEDTDRFANVDILETSEASYYFDRQFANGTYFTAPLQTYLRLMKSGKREREIAEQILRLVLPKNNK